MSHSTLTMHRYFNANSGWYIKSPWNMVRVIYILYSFMKALYTYIPRLALFYYRMKIKSFPQSGLGMLDIL